MNPESRTMSDTPETPETDRAAFVARDGYECCDVVLVSFAERLEHERNIAHKAMGDARDVLLDAMPHANAPMKILAEMIVAERDLWKENSQSNRDEYYRLAAERDKLEMERDLWKAEAERRQQI